MRRRKPLTAQELVKRDHFKRVRTLFTFSGFRHLARLTDKPFVFRQRPCDFDDVFLYENVLVLVEYTVKTDQISHHLRNKKPLFDSIRDYSSDFISDIMEHLPAFTSVRNDIYDADQFRIVIVYASRYAFASSARIEAPDVKYLDYNIVRYLETTARTIRQSARPELLEFLGLTYADVGEAALNAPSDPSSSFDGSVLPESHSNLGEASR